MPADLLHCEMVTFEQVGHAGPFVQQAPDPGQADQADADLDAARPVDARQEWILLPPGAQLIGHPAGVNLVVGQDQAVASSVRCCKREISQTCLTLPFWSSDLWLIRKA